jgi:hypothetical protein
MPKERKDTATVTFPFAFGCRQASKGVAKSITVVAPQGPDERDRFHIVRRLRPENFYVYVFEAITDNVALAFVVVDDATPPGVPPLRIAISADVWASLRRHRGSIQRVLDEFTMLINIARVRQ